MSLPVLTTDVFWFQIENNVYSEVCMWSTIYIKNHAAEQWKKIIESNNILKRNFYTEII